MVSLADIRAKYPQYGDLSDDALAHGFHDKFYSDLPFNDFAAKISYPIRDIPAPGAGPQPNPEITPAPVTNLSDAARAGVHAGLDQLSGDVQEKVGLGENAVSGVSGAAAQVPAGLAGIVQGLKNWYQGDAGAANMPAADRVRQVEGALTVQPHTEAGKGIQAGIGSIGDAAMRALPDNPAVQTFVPAGAQALATVLPLAKGLLGVRAAAAGETARAATPPASPLEAVQRAGYQIRPSDVPARNPTVAPGDVPGSLRESLTSSPQQTEGMVRNNAALSTRLIGEDIGVPNATKLTEAHYQAAERAPGQVYDQTGQAIGRIETPAPSTVDNLRAVATDQTPQGAVPATARTQLNRMIEGLQSGRYSGTQLIHDISYLRNQVGGAGARAAADVLESEMEHQLQRQPETLAGFQAARTQFAKIRNARDSTTGGLIDAADYRRVSEANPRLLTGNSAAVAQAGGEIPHLTRIPRPTADQTPIAGTAFKTLANAAARGVSHLPFMDITRPALQARIGRAAPAPGPLPVAPGLSRTAAPPPSPMGAPPGAVGVAPSQLGMALEPGRPAAPAFDLAPPEGSVFEPLQRGQALPPGQGRLNLTKQLLDQIRRRNGELPGTLSHDE